MFMNLLISIVYFTYFVNAVGLCFVDFILKYHVFLELRMNQRRIKFIEKSSLKSFHQ